MTKLKKLISIILALMVLVVLASCSVEPEQPMETVQGADNVVTQLNNDNNLGDYMVEIKGCRMAEDYQGNPIVIVTYSFTNNGDEAAAFYLSLEDEVYQDGIGLNKSYVVADSANYSSDNQSKSIKKGATLDVEVAYELNDTTSDVEVEVSEFFSFTDKKITKVFKLS